jgi:hypothetical protein
MLIFIILIILLAQILSALLSGYYGLYNSILLIQFPVQKIISLSCFIFTLICLYFNRKKIVLQEINHTLILFSFIGVYFFAFMIRLVLQKIGFSRDYDYNFEFVSSSGFFLQTVINIVVATVFILISFLPGLKINLNNRLVFIICFLVNLALPTITCVQLLYLEFINVKYF